MCSICTESYNRSTRDPIQCSACDHVACKECVRRFLMTSTTLPSCMNCHVRFPLQFLVQRLNRSWVLATYKSKMAEILASNQLGLLPETQVHVESAIRKERLTHEIAKNQREVKAMQQQMMRLKMTIQANTFILRGEQVPDRYRNYLTQPESVELDSRRKFIMACPMDKCRGFLSTQYKCGTCQQHICSDCLCIKPENHECVESDRLSAEMIKRETKPCPKCGTRFYDLTKEDPVVCISCGNQWAPESILKSKQPLPFDAPKKDESKDDDDLEVADIDLDVVDEDAEKSPDDEVDLGGDDDLGVDTGQGDDDV